MIEIDSKVIKCLLAISVLLLGSKTPELGRTQYFLGAVVLILNITLLSDGFVNFIYEVTGALNGPENRNYIFNVNIHKRVYTFYYLNGYNRYNL